MIKNNLYQSIINEDLDFCIYEILQTCQIHNDDRLYSAYLMNQIMTDKPISFKEYKSKLTQSNKHKYKSAKEKMNDIKEMNKKNKEIINSVKFEKIDISEVR